MATQHEKDKKKGTGNPKKPRKDPAMAGVDDDDDEEEDLEEVLEKDKHRQITKSLYAQLPTTSGYATMGQDRSARMLARKAKEEKDLEEARKNAPEQDPNDQDNEEERRLKSDLAK